MLLKDQCDLVDEEKRGTLGVTLCAVFHLILESPAHQQSCNKGLPGS